MITNVIAPAKTVPLGIGQKLSYAGHIFCHSGHNQLSLDSAKPRDMVSFSLHCGLAEYCCFAAIKNNCIYFFEGATIGVGMITEEQVKEALSQV